MAHCLSLSALRGRGQGCDDCYGRTGSPEWFFRGLLAYTSSEHAVIYDWPGSDGKSPRWKRRLGRVRGGGRCAGWQLLKAWVAMERFVNKPIFVSI
jgi:hypothetical protein